MLKSKNNTVILMVVFLIVMFGIRTLSNPAPKNMVENIPILLVLAAWYITNSKFCLRLKNESN